GEVVVQPRFLSSDIHLVRECAAAGLGVAFLPDARLPETRAPESKLVAVMPDVVGRERALRIVVPTALLEIPRIRVVVEEIRARVKPPSSRRSASRARRR
ncbi:MAG: LysR substrate-binding domain-containing protein, partial [Polyangiales bacterium]